jgi:UDP:flavonoid glycosyltransferase YjiC (YdhE family)
VQLVASASDLELYPVPSNVLVRPYVPQLELLSRSSVMITHGGANSVMEAIAYRVPLLIAPLCNDQFHQVHFVETAGIGRVFDRDAAWPAIAALVAHGRERMAAVSASYQRDGAAATAGLLSELAAKSRPARAS